MHLETKIVETKRLILRPFCMEDADAVFENWASDPEATRYMSWPTHKSRADSRAYIAFAMEQYERAASCEWAITRKVDSEVIGSMGVSLKNERAKCVSSGYIIGMQWWRQGYTPEAYQAVIDYLFRETETLRIEAHHDSRNAASGAVMRKCGLQYEGKFRAADANNMGICDTVCYAVLKSDYQKEHAV